MTGGYNRKMKNKLSKALSKKPKEIDEAIERGPRFDAIRISEKAFQKANDTCHALAELARERLEFYSYLCVRQDQGDDIIRDIYIAHNQVVEPANCDIDGASVSETANAVHSKGYRVMGWCHAHPGFSTRPSRKDERNNKVILAQLLAKNRQACLPETLSFSGSLEAKVQSIKGERPRLILGRNKRDLAELSIEFDKPRGIKGILFGRWLYKKMLACMQAGELKIDVPERYAFAYSIVVNGTPDQAYGEVFYRRVCSFCPGDSEVLRKKLPINPVKIPDDIQYDEESLREELLEKIPTIKEYME